MTRHARKGVVTLNRVPFSEDELKIIGEYTAPFPGMPPIPKYNTPITPAENYEALIKGEKPLWLPGFNDISMRMADFLPDNIARTKGGVDFFGLEWIYVDVAGGATRKPGKPHITDMNTWEERIKFPDLDDYPWETLKEKTNPDDNRFPVVTILNGIFERLISFMDFAGAAMALIDEDQEEAILTFFDVQADFYCKLIDKYLEYSDIRMLSFHDDWGSQRAPFFSPATVRKMILPSLKKVLTHARNEGLFVDMHSCGKNQMLAPIYIEAGVQSWSPQPMNDIDMLYEEYGKDLMLGVVPPKAVPEAREEEIDDSLEGFIQKYCHPDAHPVTVFSLGVPPKQREAIYKSSRIALCS
jgi:hypothetical protein